jgi:hypothetical protein
MHPAFVRRRLTFAPLSAGLRVAGFVTLTTIVACEDKRVAAVDTGITRDSAITVLAQGAKSNSRDSMPNIYKRSEYLLDGKRLDVLYFTENNEKPSKDSVAWKDLTPIVFLENRLIGKGWQFWDSLGTANKIAVPKRED